MDLNNNGLKALFDIHEDILYGDEKKLNKIRNTLTHRVLKIKLFSVDEEKDTLTEEELFNRTVDLAKIVRNAIIYLMAMVLFYGLCLKIVLQMKFVQWRKQFMPMVQTVSLD